MKTIEEWQQELDLPPLLELLDVLYEGVTHRFVSSYTPMLSPIMWESNLYSPFPFKLENIGYTTDNGVDQSRLAVSAIDKDFSSALSLIPDLTGAQIRWVLIFEEYVGTNALVQQHRLKITRMSARSKKGIVYECSGLVDERIMLPRRQMLREGTLNGRFAGLGLNWT